MGYGKNHAPAGQGALGRVIIVVVDKASKRQFPYSTSFHQCADALHGLDPIFQHGRLYQSIDREQGGMFLYSLG